MSALPSDNVTNVTASSEQFMLNDLMRSALVPEDFKHRPKPLLPNSEGQDRYRLHYTEDYYKDRIDRPENKYIGPRGVPVPHMLLGSEIEFASGNVNATVEGYKKARLFELTTGVPTMVMDHCWDFGEGGGEVEDGAESKTVRLDILEGLRPGKIHLGLFDGDWATRPQVAKALATFALELDGYGVQARFPDFGVDADGKKQGYDDWFVGRFGVDRSMWPNKEDVIKAIFALPQVPVTELEEAKKWALSTVERFNRSHTDLSDRGNATLLIRLLGRNNIRYLTDVGCWVFWDGSRWIDKGETPLELTNVVSRHYFLRAQRLELMAQAMPADEAHSERRDALVKDAKAKQKWAEGKCSSVPGRQAMLKDAAERSILRAKLSDFDTDGDLLAVFGGVVDLRTGELRPERQEDMILKRCAVRYDGDEPSDEGAKRAKQFIAEITGLEHGKPDAQRARWLQRRIGAALRGRNPLDAMEIWHGKGANGKSVLAKALCAALGDYAANMPAGALLTNARGRDAEGARPFLVRAIGRRLIVASETSDTAYLDEPQVKLLTGGDKLNVRGNYQDGGEYGVTFTIILLTNPLPNVAEGDAALWDRLAPFPFRLRWRRAGVLSAVDADDASLPPADPWLKDAMAEGKDEAALRWLLWWAISGGVDWESEGLGDVPPDLSDNASTYRGAQDKLGRWMEDMGIEFIGLDNGSIPTSEAFRLWHDWAGREGLKAGTAATFSKRLIEYARGKVASGKSSGNRVLKGLARVAGKF